MAVRLVLLVVGLVMLFDHLVTGVSGRGVDAERLDVEMATDEMELAVVDIGVPGVHLGEGVHLGQADGAVRCAAGIAHGARYCHSHRQLADVNLRADFGLALKDHRSSWWLVNPASRK